MAIYALLENWLQRPLRQLQLLQYHSVLRHPPEAKSGDPELVGTLGDPVVDSPHLMRSPQHLPPLCSVAYHGYTIVYLGSGSGKNLET